jgi:hypothetical protein
MFFFNDKQPPTEVDLISFEYIDTNKNIDDINDVTTQNTSNQPSTIINDDIECKFIDNDNIIVDHDGNDDVINDVVDEEEEEEDYEDEDDDEDYDEEGDNIIYVISLNNKPLYFEKNSKISRERVDDMVRKYNLNDIGGYHTSYIYYKTLNEVEIIRTYDLLFFSYNYVIHTFKISKIYSGTD